MLTSGLPADRRWEVVRRVRSAAESAGAEACFVGLAAGVPTVGLGDAELERLVAGAAGKASARDLPAAVARKADAGTTVAGTLAMAHRAGVEVMVTGGIGGVHPAAGPPDVSADLLELARTPAIVVCSGPKAFLDLAGTLERLETLGVPIVGYGTGECPAFWCRTSGHPLPDRADTPDEVVARWRVWRALRRPAALLVFVPPPKPDALGAEESERYAREALGALRDARIVGPDVTPFLLRRIAESSGGRSVQANLALLERNASVAAQIAVRLEEATR